MSWITKEHKILYSKAFEALYDDIKSTASSVVDSGKNIISIGYNNIMGYNSSDSSSDIDDDEMTDDIIVKVNKKGRYISKIWSVKNQNKTKIKPSDALPVISLYFVYDIKYYINQELLDKYIDCGDDYIYLIFRYDNDYGPEYYIS